MHEQRADAQEIERVREHLPTRVGITGKLSLPDAVSPILVRIADELVHKRHHRMQLDLAHEPVIGMQRFLRAHNDLLANRAKRHHTFEVFLRLIEATACQSVEHVGEKRSLFERRVGHARIGALRLVGVERFGLEPNRLLIKSEREEMRAQLLRGVVIEQLISRRRLHSTRRGRLLIAEQQVVICNERRLAQRR